jgi:hypothetical protein
MADIIIGLIIVAMVGLAIRYIYKAKKSGVKCIGCPNAGTCGSKNTGSCGCHSEEN